MATLYTISGILAGPDGVPTGGTITIRLSQPAVIAATGEVVPRELKPTVNASTGAWSQALYANVDMSPAGTYYTAIERTSDGAVAKYDFTVAQANAKLADRVTTTVPTSGTAPRFTTLTVDGAATFTAGPAVIGADPGGTQILRVGGTAHVGGLLTLDGGITVTAGAVTLPAGSVADSALSANVALLNNAQTFSGAKTFSAGVTVGGSLLPSTDNAIGLGDATHRWGTFYAISANLYGNLIQTAGYAQVPSLTVSSGAISYGAAVSKVVPGATSFSIRDNADANDNLLVSNAGAVTVRSGLTANPINGSAFNIPLNFQNANQYIFNSGPITIAAAAFATNPGTLTLGTATAATATAGTSGAPPAQVAGYLIAYLGATLIKLPYYAA